MLHVKNSFWIHRVFLLAFLPWPPRCGRAVGVRLRESDDLREPTVLPSSEAVRSRSASSTIPAMSRLEQL